MTSARRPAILIGDRVALAGNWTHGRVMTVFDLETDRDEWAWCNWLDGVQMNKARCLVSCLVRIEDVRKRKDSA